MKDIGMLYFEGNGREDIVLIDPADMHKAEEYQTPGTELIEAFILSANTPSSIPSSIPLETTFRRIA